VIHRIVPDDFAVILATKCITPDEYSTRHGQRCRKPGEEHLYREEKYASVYEINMLRCIFCGLCEEACPKEAIFLTDRIVYTGYKRSGFIYGKDLLVEPMEKDKRIDVSKRQTQAVLEFKKNPVYAHNTLYTKALKA
ncbi:MAG: 4Fe-4S binding protein, partial [Bacteroidia bacterium]|nr:4Fe-4S binding protein [Bacteroidia bacterium]